MPAQEVLQAVARHATGDWGLLNPHDRQQNEDALRQGGRLVSVYQSSTGQRFYVITESSRDLTTVLLPGGLLSPAELPVGGWRRCMRLRWAMRRQRAVRGKCS